MKSFRLTEEELEQVAEKYATPCMVVSLNKIEENYHYLRKKLPMVKIFYAMKANPAPEILKRLSSLGSSFDVASAGEIGLLSTLGIDGKDMIYANPVKNIEGIKVAYGAGVDKFTFDDESELPKLAKYAPGSKVLVRIQVENPSAVVNLNEKFGTLPEMALPLLKRAQELGLVPAGICFHIGSQSLKADAYRESLRLCKGLFEEAARQGMDLKILDIGGGLPIPSAQMPELDLDTMTDNIRSALEEYFPHTEIWAEPGRYIAGTAVNLITSVIGTKLRNGQPWYILDDGLYGSFNGILFDHWEYKLESFKQGKKVLSTFVGPTCDSIDVVARDIYAPHLSVGDKLLSIEVGAYCSAASTGFNGFSPAGLVVYEEEFASGEVSAVS